MSVASHMPTLLDGNRCSRIYADECFTCVCQRATGGNNGWHKCSFSSGAILMTLGNSRQEPLCLRLVVLEPGTDGMRAAAAAAARVSRLAC